jgi:hypothetical protein
MSPPKFPDNLPLDMLQPRLIAGDVSQAILQVEFIPEELKTTHLYEAMRPLRFKEQVG